jgi:uracil-DNA glycosylase family 4
MRSLVEAPSPLALVRTRIVDCEACPRLRRYCARVALEKKPAHRHDLYWGRPVPGFGDPAARVLIVGLAPAAHGANRTGRVFTGDGSGDFLMRALHANGFANIPTARSADDGLLLRDAYIVAAVRCAPPGNKPTVDEIAACRPHLRDEVAALPRVRVAVALGKIAYDAYCALLKQAGLPSKGRPAFGHGVLYRAGADVPAVLCSYHPSRQNTNTGKLTPAMLAAIFRSARALAGS